MKMSCIVASLFFVVVSVVKADMITTWNVGSGQPKDNFLFDAYPGFGSGGVPEIVGGNILELGLRTIHRQSAIPAPVSGNTYTVHAGYQTGGEFGAPVTNLSRNRWNFDYHVYYSGGVQNLDSLTMTIVSPTGNTVSAPFFNMKVANNDNVTGSIPFPGGDSQNPAFFIQDSQNPVFAPWFNAPFNMDVEGLYTFTLTAVEGNSTASVMMQTLVMPAPSTMALIAIGGIVSLRRRR